MSQGAHWRNVTRAQPCPVCGHGSWCSRAEDGGWAVCRRVDTGDGKAKVDESGMEYWLYRLNGAPSSPVPELPTSPAAPCAELKVLNRVYGALLSALPLSASHRRNLTERGLPESGLARLGYASLADRRTEVAVRLVEQFGASDCAGVPGLFVKEGERPRWSIAGPRGLLIPVRTRAGEVAALKIRADKPGEWGRYLYLSSNSKSQGRNGPSPGCPVHIPLWDGSTAEVRLTEGELKADVTTARTGVLTLSVPGVSAWRKALPALHELGARTVRLAFDADGCRNRFVAGALGRTAEALAEAGVEVLLEVWDEADGKGIDDLLAAGKEPAVISGFLIRTTLAGILAEARRADPPPVMNGRSGAGHAPAEAIPAEPVLEMGDDGLPPPPPENAPVEVSARRLHLTDYGNAERLVRRHGEHLRYCPVWGKWFLWSGRHWAEDETGGIYRRAKETVRSIYAEAAAIRGEDEPEKSIRAAVADWAKKSEAGARIEALISLAESEAGIAVTPDVFDADPWALNCLNGTLDLRTGKLRKHRPEDLLTLLCPVTYEPGAECPLFLAFLNRIMDGNEAMVSYLQRVFGFALTGIPPDRAMFFLYGRGRNGKSTLVEVFHDILGSYAKKTLAETLLAKSNGDSIPNDLAELRGARMVSTAELTQGRRLNEARIKDLTGRDRIKARFLRQEFFEFRPQFKLLMYGNHKPTIRGTDTGIWDRVKLLPFTVTIPEDEKDEQLPDKLRAELPGILAWAVRGCLEWQRAGLRHPDEVRAATQAYREEQDPLVDFLADSCVLQPSAQVTNPSLWTAYEEWCQRNGERYALGRKQFSQALQERGFQQERNGSCRYWTGLGLLNTETGEPLPGPQNLFSDDASAPWDTSCQENPHSHPCTAHVDGNGIPASSSVICSEASEQKKVQQREDSKQAIPREEHLL